MTIDLEILLKLLIDAGARHGAFQSALMMANGSVRVVWAHHTEQFTCPEFQLLVERATRAVKSTQTPNDPTHF